MCTFAGKKRVDVAFAVALPVGTVLVAVVVVLGVLLCRRNKSNRKKTQPGTSANSCFRFVSACDSFVLAVYWHMVDDDVHGYAFFFFEMAWLCISIEFFLLPLNNVSLSPELSPPFPNVHVFCPNRQQQ